MSTCRAIFLCALLAGCSSLPTVDELYERPFCYVKGKWDRDKKSAYVGLACKF